VKKGASKIPWGQKNIIKQNLITIKQKSKLRTKNINKVKDKNKNKKYKYKFNCKDKYIYKWHIKN